MSVFSIVAAIVFISMVDTNQCDAQQDQKSLFVIKTPDVERSAYGQKPSAIVFAPISYQQEETTPREDDGSDDAKGTDDMEMEQLDDDDELDDLDDENELIVGDEDDDEDFDSKPPVVPMTSWNLKPMSSITPGLRPVSGKSPADQSWQLTNRSSMPIVNSNKLFAWAAPDFRHNPLYFEDVALERYGQTKGFFRQPFVSGVHYLKSAAFLPYYSLYDPINSCDGPLGYCRPGDRVNCVQNKHYFGNPFRGQRQ